jgi:hypothetical protein
MKKMSFMESFFVIGEKGDYLRLIKYDPEITANNPRARIMKNRKKALYYGWAHRSRLLLSKQSSLDMATGFKNKAVTIVGDSFALARPHLIFDSDSVLAWKDENLSIPGRKIPMHEILHILKSSADRKKVLVSCKTTLDPLEAPNEVPGWISASAIKEIGQRLFVNIKPVINERAVFVDKNGVNPLEINRETCRRTDFYTKNNPVFRYSPVRSYCADSCNVHFNTMLAAPVIDGRLNYVLNLNGNKIMYDDFLRLEKDLRELNIVFVFEGKERVFEEYSRIMNVIQNMQMLFGQADDLYRYKFGAVIAYQDSIKRVQPRTKSCGLTDSFADMMGFLMSEKDSVSGYRPIASSQAWEGLRKATDMIEEYPNGSNVLIVIGESGYSEYADSMLVRRIANANGRILGYQTYNKKLSDEDNNFVLQIENMIDVCSRHDAVTRKERLVYPEQYKPHPAYRESTRNTYALDFPQKSMMQGWVLFPGKDEDMQMDILSKSIDTLVRDVRNDNDTVIARIDRAFHEFGNKLYRYDPLWVEYNGMDSLWQLNMDFYRRTYGVSPAWLAPGFTISAESDDSLEYHLLFSESEIREILAFLTEITKYEPDYKYRKKKNAKKIKFCNCPDDSLFSKAHRRANRCSTKTDVRHTGTLDIYGDKFTKPL